MGIIDAVLLCILVGVSTSKMEAVDSSRDHLFVSPLPNKDERPNKEGRVIPAKIEENFLWQSVNSSGRGEEHSSIVKRTVPYPGSDLEFGGPFCYDRYVTGNCRYRIHPDHCFQYEWTAYAIILNLGGGVVRSEPPGLLADPGNQERVKVWLKVSCCTPYVRILTLDPYGQEHIACMVDIRELQGLHPAEIAGIVIGVVIFLFILIMSTVLLARNRKRAVVTRGMKAHGHAQPSTSKRIMDMRT